jgi:hypothetical protein
MKSASVKLLSTGFPVYHDLAEFNRLVEEVIAVTGRLAIIPFLRRELLKAHAVMIEEIRASVNDSVTEVLQDREFNNAAFYERRRREWQKQFEDPQDAIILAKRHTQSQRTNNLKSKDFGARSQKRKVVRR